MADRPRTARAERPEGRRETTMPNAHPRGLSTGGDGCTTFLGPGKSSVRQARDIVRKWLAEYGLQDLVDITELLVSELATNAVVHAGGRYRLTLSVGIGTLRCEVADERRHLPLRPNRQAEDHDADSESGRGLLLVDALAHRWGSRLIGEGKEVWFELEIAAPDRTDGAGEAGARHMATGRPRPEAVTGRTEPHHERVDHLYSADGDWSEDRQAGHDEAFGSACHRSRHTRLSRVGLRRRREVGEVGQHVGGVRCEAGEGAEGVGGLVDEHAAAVEDAAVVSKSGLEQRGSQGAVDEVGEPQALVEPFHGERGARVGVRADGCGVDQAVRACEFRAELLREADFGAFGSGVLVERLDEGVGALGDRVHHGEAGDAEVEQGVGDGRARTSGAEQHHVPERDFRQPSDEGRGESRDVGVVADGPALRGEDDGVDRTEARRLGGEFVQVRHDGLLARVGDVEPVEAAVPGGAGEVADVLGGEAEVVDVEKPVEVAHAVPAGLALVEVGAERTADA